MASAGSTPKNNMAAIDEDRRRRLRDIEVKIQDPRSIINIDCLIDAVQNIMSDSDHPAIRKIKNIDAFVTRYGNSCDMLKTLRMKPSDFNVIKVIGNGKKVSGTVTTVDKCGTFSLEPIR